MRKIALLLISSCIVLLFSCRNQSESSGNIANAVEAKQLDSAIVDIKALIGKGLNGDIAFFDSSIVKCKRAIVDYRLYLSQDSARTAELYHRMAVSYRGRSNSVADFDSSSIYFANAARIREKLLPVTEVELANTYLQWGDLYTRKSQWKEAISVLEKSEKVLNFNSISDKTKVWTIDVALRLGSALSQIGEYKNARERLSTVIRFLNANTIDQNRLALANRYYAETYLGVPDSASLYFSRSIAINKSTQNIDELVRGSAAFAFALSSKGNYAKAKEILLTAINILGKDEPLQLARLYNQLGLACTGLQDYEKAIFYGEKLALSILDTLPDIGEIRYERYSTTANIGDAYIAQKDFRKALNYYTKSLNIISGSPDGDLLSPPSDASLNSIYYKQNAAIALLLKARTLKALAVADRQNEIAYHKAALLNFQSLLVLRAKIKQELWSENSKVDISQHTDWLPEALDIAMVLWRQTGDDLYKEQAFYLVQQSKAQMLLEHTQGEQGKMLSNVAESELKTERELQAEISALRKLKNETPNDAAIEARLIAAEGKLRSFTAVLEKKYPLYYQFKYDYSPLPIEDIKKILPKNMALLEFMPAGRLLYTFVVTKQRFDCYTSAIQASDSLAALKMKLILSDADSVDLNHERLFFEMSQHLHHLLIEPLMPSLNGIDRLKIVPAGWLYHVSFEALVKKNERNFQWSDKVIPYLIRDYAISYQFSTKELAFRKVKNSGKVSIGSFGISYDDEITRNSLRGVSCDYFERTRGGGKLIYALKEARQVEAFWGSGDCYLNQEASKAKFINTCRDYDILHLALHGVMDCEQPDMTELIFAKNQQDEDNIMRLYEIAGLNMRCDLAVLSACHSGYGKLEGTEGVISLGRAFAMAGCHSLVTSNSYVVDDTSPQLFEVFYQQLKMEAPKDVALQRAINQYLDDHEGYMRLPYRWANFHLWGDTEQIQGKGTNWFWFIIAGIIVTITGAMWIILRRKNQSI
ncbi:MAG: CHAT domain-containing protein [Saprospiraceae bacterium]